MEEPQSANWAQRRVANAQCNTASNATSTAQEGYANTYTITLHYKKDLVQKRKHQEQEEERRQQRQVLYIADQTFGLVTQNVNGLGANEAARATWFQAFGERDDHGRSDVMVIQETHVEAAEVLHYQKLYASRWGYRTGHDQPAHSFWAPSKDRKGGVAVLIDHYGLSKRSNIICQSDGAPTS
ncbi:hypothetical protein PF010_g4063 [Phytophthora fragariae]|uniref:Endonuclease/exonuclease/phosphatase domain-containing protein n=1 Tax=Phytophthora fragariae TaxID=53985 RepID=A0A6A3IM49_9STRA|nr:hypothetical protein PF003_g37506 [Phytophthora fragariae]KAE8943565.1 hypothetical protein PF009_g6711 [Phytophthora fragariae]KAE8980653.1 hypothetical protein PF011_g22348 [Phytophthora fragariae]KAE9129772.1 hypothetical protein PF010_g4063 [Phytophthora fragariae]KAE9150261.1 hypothetical protein PF006_g5336 [Phytophthora fragariae]